MSPADPLQLLIWLASWVGVAWMIRESIRREVHAPIASARDIGGTAVRSRAPAPPVYGPVPTVQWTGTGALIGRRIWGLCYWWRDAELRLASIHAPWAWDGPVFQSHVRPGLDRPYPGFEAGARAGVYALKPEAAAWMDLEPVTAGLVSGQVALSGRVVVHEWGYRAERCTIRDLRLEPPAILALGSDEAVRDAVQALERRYQVPVSVAPFDPAALSDQAFPRPDSRRFFAVVGTNPDDWRLG
jgi:hypothetical protein